MAVIDKGSTTSQADVVSQGGSSGAALVTTPGYSSTGTAQGAGVSGAPTFVGYGELDGGSAFGTRVVKPIGVDQDGRLIASIANMLDREQFNYTAQNTGKYSHTFTSMTATVSASGLLCNSGASTTTAQGFTFGTFAEFPVGGPDEAVTYCETALSLSVVSNVIASGVTFDVGMFRRGASTAFLGTDGVYFRFSSAGIQGVANNNATETVAFTNSSLAFSANDNHRYGIAIAEKTVYFFIDDVLYGRVTTALANPLVVRSPTLPWSLRQTNGGTPSTALQVTVTSYFVSNRGPEYQAPFSVVGNRTLGSYQGLSGGTMGSLAGNVANNTQPSAAVASNTALTANLISGLGGTCLETDTLAVNTDGIIMSYQVPAGAISVQGRRLVVTGIRIDSFIQTALTGGGYNDRFILCWGHTAVSLATAESASFATGTAKAPRKHILGSRTVASGAVALVQLSTISMTWANPIYVNPNEFIALARRKVGTAPSAGVVQHCVTLDYGWE